MRRKSKSQSNAVLICCCLAILSINAVLPSTETLVGIAATRARSQATLSGVVTDSMGGQLPDATLSLYSVDRVIQTKSDKKGQFQFSDVPSGTYQLEAARQGFKTRKMAAIQVTNKNEPLSISLEIAAAGICDSMNSISYIDMDGRKLIGIVLNSRQPVAGAKVELVSASGAGVLATGRSNGKGEFTFADIEPGQYILVVSHSGYREERTESFWIARGNTTKIEIQLIKEGLIRVCQ